jgi:hypothetical protein
MGETLMKEGIEGTGLVKTTFTIDPVTCLSLETVRLLMFYRDAIR